VRKIDYVKRIIVMPVDYAKDRWRWFRGLSRKQQLALIGGVSAIILIVIPTATYLYFVRDINDPERLMNRNNTGIVLEDRHGEALFSFGRSADERNATLDEIPEHTQEALIAAEDRGFYDHAGFSARNIAGALYANILNRDITRYGGSTITQQLVKNNLLTDRQTFMRKYQELAMSIAIERRYTKDEILEMYLNSVYFGESAFGIIQAAETYFDKSPEQLTPAESALLIGLLPAPSIYSPISGEEELAYSQQELVLDRMLVNEFISEDEHSAILAEELSFAEVEPNVPEYARHFVDMVMDELTANYGEEEVARSGFRVTTTIDATWQREAERIVQNRIDSVRHLGATNAGLVAIDPKTGEIRALVGSADWDDEQFGQVNMATSARQPGSTFKSIYYAEAIEQQLFTPASIIRDERKEYGDYRPENFDFRFRGDVSLRHALAQSLNIPSIEVMRELGIQETIDTAQRMGIKTVNETPEVYGLPLALGTAETELMDITNAYAAFAHGGEHFTPGTVSSIKNKFGRTAFERNERPNRVQSAEASYIISSILADDAARAPTFGSSLNVSGHDVAVKTGTTNDNRDAWTIGYTPQITVGVWVGDNENNPMAIGGSAAAGPIWRESITTMLDDLEREDFDAPRGVVNVRICNVHGDYVESFIRGTQPDRCDPDFREDDIDERRRREEEEERRRQQEEEERRRQEEAEAEEDEEETELPIDDPDDEDDEDEEDDEDDEDDDDEEDDNNQTPVQLGL
jgi:1A family penicillin-binding protein